MGSVLDPRDISGLVRLFQCSTATRGQWLLCWEEAGVGAARDLQDPQTFSSLWKKPPGPAHPSRRHLAPQGAPAALEGAPPLRRRASASPLPSRTGTRRRPASFPTAGLAGAGGGRQLVPPAGRGGAGQAGPRLLAAPPGPRSARELRRRRCRRRRPGAEPGRAANMLSRLGALLQEAVGAVRPGRPGRAGPRPEGRARGRGRSRRAGGRRTRARLGEGTPTQAAAPFPGPPLSPVAPLPHSTPVSRGFLPDRATSSPSPDRPSP